jgi:hypothetical protein
MNDDYVQRLFHDQLERDRYHGKLFRVLPWLLATIGVLSLAAYGLRAYWYPYVSPYLYS